MSRMTLADITMDYIRERVIVDSNGCWIWRHAAAGPKWKEGKGYAVVNCRYAGEQVYKVHRVAFYNTHGHWPLIARHRCDVSMCVNPDHIEDGTQVDNMRDLAERGVINRVKGEQHPRARLTEELVREIRNSPLSLRKAATWYGMGHSTIGQIRRREIWKHVE